MKRAVFSISTLLVVGFVMVAHAADGTGKPAVPLATMMDAYRRPKAIPSPADNPTSEAKVHLGKALFFDPRISGSGAISCATCHNPSLDWEDGQTKGVGDKGGRLGRHTPTILNVAWSEPLFWDGRADTLEDQAKGPMASVAEMNMPHEKVVARIQSIPGYQAAFKDAFPGRPIDIDTVARAVAAYERTVVSGTAPFDRWVGGDQAAISEDAKRGFVIFNTKANCASCHAGWRLTDDGFHDIGLSDADMGRAKIMPGMPILEHAFKTPTLRNVVERAPYMHDGSMVTLEEVVDHYDHGFVQRASLSDGIKPLHLTPREKTQLVAFMRTLSSKDAPVTFPALPR